MSLVVSIQFEDTKIVEAMPFLFRRLSDEEQALIDQYPQLNLVVNFVKKCWQTTNYHTPSFRVFAARITKAITESLDYLEINVFNQYSSTTPSLAIYTTEAEIFMGNIHKSCQDLRWYMKLSAANAPFVEGTMGAVTMEVSQRAFAVLTERIESFDSVEKQVNGEPVVAPFSMETALLDLMSGISIEVV